MWRFVAVDHTGTRLGELSDATDRKVTWRLLAAGEAEFHLPGDSWQATWIAELRNDILVYRNNDLLFRGRITVTRDAIGPDDYDLEVHVADYRGLLARRTVWPSSTLVYAAVDQGAIAWDLIHDTQALTGGALGITQGTGATTGVTRDRTYEAGKNLEEALAQLAAVDDGFDWEIDPLRKLNIFYPGRGRAADDVEFQISYDRTGGNVASLDRGVDPSEYANTVRVSGADGVAPNTQSAADLGTRPEGRWERQYGATDLTTSTSVVETAQRMLADLSLYRPSYTATLAATAAWSPATFWLGDTCKIRIKRGRVDVDTTGRCLELAVDIDDSNNETVSLTFDRPPVGDLLLRDVRRLAGRVEGLARR